METRTGKNSEITDSRDDNFRKSGTLGVGHMFWKEQELLIILRRKLTSCNSDIYCRLSSLHEFILLKNKHRYLLS